MSTTSISGEAAVLVLDPHACDKLLEKRRESGADRYDETWEGMYVMSPLPNLEHQYLVGRLYSILDHLVTSLNIGRAWPGANVTDREIDWKYNFRCPDVVVLLQDGIAKPMDVALLGGPDFIVEVMSPGDRTMQKLDFYSRLGVRELLVVDRETKELQLFGLSATKLESQGSSTTSDGRRLDSRVLPLTFCVRAGEPTRIVVRRTDEQATEWLI